MLAVGLLAAAALVVFGRGRVAAELGVPPLSVVSLATLVTLASTVAAGPFVLWRVVEDIRYTSRLTSEQAERVPADVNGIDEEVLERVRTIVPPDATYAIAAGRAVADRERPLRTWSTLSLLPRIPVSDPEDAEWVVTWGLPPSRLGVDVADERVIVAPDEPPNWYVARVVS